MTEVPKYIQDLMARAKYVVPSDYHGVTLSIEKRTIGTFVDVLNEEVEQLQTWLEAQINFYITCPPLMRINKMPYMTSYAQQFAIVTIRSDVMKLLRPYIK